MIRRVICSLGCLVMIGMAIGQTDRVKEFEKQLKQPSTREAMLRFLATDEGAKSAEHVLALLLKLPQKSELPAAPAFPFDADKASRYQKAYAEAAGLPLTFRNRHGMTF